MKQNPFLKGFFVKQDCTVKCGKTGTLEMQKSPFSSASDSLESIEAIAASLCDQQAGQNMQGPTDQ